MRSKKNLKKIPKKYRDYIRVKNYAEHKCYRIKHNLNIKSTYVGWDNYDVYDKEIEGIDDFISALEKIATGRFTFDTKYFYLEKEEDAIMFKLRF